MSLNSTRQDIFNYFNSNFSSSEIVFDGSSMGDLLVKETDPWLYAYINWGPEIQQSMGTPEAYFERIGILQIKLYVLLSDGIGTVDSITDSICSVFRAARISEVTFKSSDIGRDEIFEGMWKVRFINIPFNIYSKYQIF